MPSTKPASGSESSPALHYTGDASGVPHLSPIPSRDLSAADVRRYAALMGLSRAGFVALATAGPFTEAAPANPAANTSADDSGKE